MSLHFSLCLNPSRPLGPSFSWTLCGVFRAYLAAAAKKNVVLTARRFISMVIFMFYFFSLTEEMESRLQTAGWMSGFFFLGEQKSFLLLLLFPCCFLHGSWWNESNAENEIVFFNLWCIILLPSDLSWFTMAVQWLLLLILMLCLWTFSDQICRPSRSFVNAMFTSLQSAPNHSRGFPLLPSTCSDDQINHSSASTNKGDSSVPLPSCSSKRARIAAALFSSFFSMW